MTQVQEDGHQDGGGQAKLEMVSPSGKDSNRRAKIGKEHSPKNSFQDFIVEYIEQDNRAK